MIFPILFLFFTMTVSPLLSMHNVAIAETEHVGPEVSEPNAIDRQIVSTLTESEKKLLAAAEKGEVKEVDRLCREGVNVDTKDSIGWTALHYAARHGHDNVCKLLLKQHKAFINARARYGSRPLHYAAENGHEAVCATLIKEGADVNVSDYLRRTPVYYAAKYSTVAITVMLLEAGAKPDAEDTFEHTPASVAQGETRAAFNRAKPETVQTF